MVACVALGLWIHYQYVVASADWTARDTAYSQLTESALYTSVATRELPTESKAELTRGLNESLSGRQGGHDSIVLTDSDMNLIGISDVESIIRDAIPETLVWQPEPDDGNELELGTVASSIGPFLAVRWPTKRGFGLMLRPEALIVADGDVVRKSLPAAAGISLLWIAALQVVILYLTLARINAAYTKQMTESNNKAVQQADELIRTQDAIIFGLAKLADSRDPETGMHLERISMFATRLATAMSRKPRYRDVVTPSFVSLIGISSALHDIGKVGVEDSILKKPGSLTDDERKRMQEHTLIGNECLRQIELRLGQSNFLQMAREIGLNHHERWDGDGYPNQISGSRIPLSARIVAVADVYDALANRRVYKDAYSHQKCVEMIREGAGSHFDPEIVEVFCEVEAEFAQIHKRFGEQAPSRDGTVSPAALECLESPDVSPLHNEQVSTLENNNGTIEKAVN